MGTAQAETKVIPQDFVLITYDIPAKAAKVRYDFLKKARAIGAEAHTDSVYLMPYSQGAMELANELEAAGHAVVWGPVHQPDKTKAQEFMVKYETALKARCDTIEQRLVIAQEYITAGKLEMARRMAIKTGKLLQQLAKIAQNYNPEWLIPRIGELIVKWKDIYGEEA